MIPDTYTLLKEESLPDIHAEGLLLRHKKSGARVALIPCSDENKVFSIAFRTPPADSTGVAHITEHTVLCGSRNYPVRDPFIELVKGSLNTFLNAITFPDKTIYPIASCNDQDFRNLMHVYLDAVFYPRIYEHEEIFRQEGWHYEMKEGRLTLNGVVYSEMKGAFSSPEGVLERSINNSLFPDTPYGVDSGGDPECIPDLTYEQFLDFHRKWYHPSNSYIFLYGDMDMTERLTFLDEAYLRDFDAIEVPSGIPEQAAFPEMARIKMPYPVAQEDPLEDNTYLSWQKVVGSSLDTRTMLALDVLDYALLSATGSPIEKALLDAGIGSDILGNLETDLRQPFFSVVAKNANEEDAERFVEIIENVLREEAERGISEKALLAGINYEEFRAREADFGRFPKGLMYNFSMLTSWLYDDEKPFDELSPLGHYAWLREQIGTGYFENLIRERFLNNTHGSVLILTPERGLAEKREAALAEELEAKKAAMTEAELATIQKKAEALQAWQGQEDSPEALETIPLLDRSDIRRNVAPVSNTVCEGGVPVIHHDVETNGIAYLQILFPLDQLPESLVPFAGILVGVLGSVDTDAHTYDELSHEINMYTGGVEALIDAYSVYGKEEEQLFLPYYKFKGKALYGEMPVLFNMIGEILTSTHLSDEKRIREILRQGVSRLQMKFTTAGHLASVLRAGAGFGGVHRFKELTEGVALYRLIKDLDAHFEERKEDLIRILMLLTEGIFTKKDLLISFTGAKEQVASVKELANSWLLADDGCEAHPAAESEDKLKEAGELAGRLLALAGDGLLPDKTEGLMYASDVQYVARCGKFNAPYTGAMHILRTILGYDYLWKQLREQGGAYGCMSAFTRSKTGYFVSYRDPHLKRTLDVYDGTPEYLEAFDADEREMTKYIIGTVSGMDVPLTPEQSGARSMTVYMTGVPLDVLQKERDEVLDAAPEDIRKLAVPVREMLADSRVCVIGGESKIKEHEELFDVTGTLL